MVADGTSARPLEGQQPMPVSCLMTYEARNLLVPRMGKAVGLSRLGGWRADAELNYLRDRGFEERRRVVLRAWQVRSIDAGERKLQVSR